MDVDDAELHGEGATEQQQAGHTHARETSSRAHDMTESDDDLKTA
jgi:hypothetical protein